MRLAKLITHKRITALYQNVPALKDGRFSKLFLVLFLLILLTENGFSQDNSPYTRYGLGDIVPSSNINTRAMGGIAAGYNDFLAINFSNPASYGSFQTVREPKSKKILYGRAI